MATARLWATGAVRAEEDPEIEKVEQAVAGENRSTVRCGRDGDITGLHGR